MKIETKDCIKFASNGMLNNPGFNSTAAYSYCLEISKEESPWLQSDVDFTIAGCGSAYIDLSFNCSDELEFENSLNKIDILKKAINEFEQDFIEYKKLYNITKTKKDGAKNSNS